MLYTKCYYLWFCARSQLLLLWKSTENIVKSTSFKVNKYQILHMMFKNIFLRYARSIRVLIPFGLPWVNLAYDVGGLHICSFCIVVVERILYTYILLTYYGTIFTFIFAILFSNSLYFMQNGTLRRRASFRCNVLNYCGDRTICCHLNWRPSVVCIFKSAKF